MILGKNFTWQDLDLHADPAHEALYKRIRFYTLVLFGVSVSMGAIVMYSARKLIKIRERTQGDVPSSGLGVNYAEYGEVKAY